MEFFTALSKIWGFFVVVLILLTSNRLQVLFAVKRLKRNLENLKTYEPTLLENIQGSISSAEGTSHFVKELNGILGSNVKINKLGIFYFDSEKQETIFKSNGNQKELSITETLPKSHSKNVFAERVNTCILRMRLNDFSLYRKGNSIEVFYKMKETGDSVGSLLYLEIKVKSIFYYIIAR